MKATGEPTKNIVSQEELMFEYDQLSREILQQDVQAIQILAGIIIMVSALMTIAFGTAVSSLLVKGILFLLGQVIVCIGLWQTVHRAYIRLLGHTHTLPFIYNCWRLPIV